MKEELALRLLGKVMEWDNDRAREEFAWLSTMSRHKYDGYHDYLAGVRFAESLLNWLQQFEQSDRETAYGFVRNNLVYIGTAELQHLVESVYPETIQKGIVGSVANRLGIKPYEIWTHANGVRAYGESLRKTLFLGLSDGARMDVFRRANADVISNEQVIGLTQIHVDKWTSALEQLRTDLDDSTALFESAYLIDDFVGSGKTLLRRGDDEEPWKGKLVKFLGSVSPSKYFEDGWTLHIHHYLATAAARSSLRNSEKEARLHYGSKWFPKVVFSFGLEFSEELQITKESNKDFLDVVDRYYDPDIKSEHSDVGGSGFKRGFANCSLPLILEHNTPNNSLALLWAESKGSNGNHAMRPLFRRRQRHS